MEAQENSAQKISFPNKSEDRFNQRAPDFDWAPKKQRWAALDVARGFAIILMILSHGVKGVVNPNLIPSWGWVPVHLTTKFSSSLFIIVFGMSLSLFFLPHIGKATWRKKQWWMFKRGIELLIWYKVLSVVQMFQFYPKPMILKTLEFGKTTDFVEILSFYAFALLWLPWFLPIWSRMGHATKIITTIGTLAAGQWLHYHFDFWGYEILKAYLVENEGHYSFGQLNRGAVIFLGLYIGDLYHLGKEGRFPKEKVAWGCIWAGVSLLTFFLTVNYHQLYKVLDGIAHNVNKHPWGTDFFTFSMGGALCILGLSLLSSEKIQRYLKPVSYIGQNSLNAFIIHIVVIFYFYRYYFKLHYKVTYMQSLQLAGLCVVTTIAIVAFWNFLKKASK